MTFPGFFSVPPVRVNKNLCLQSHANLTLFKEIFTKPCHAERRRPIFGAETET